jgi:hypothetical protein
MDPRVLAQRYGYPSEYNNYDTQWQGAKEAIGWSWYDTTLYTSAATQALALFTIMRATLNLSNMEAAGQLASPKAFFLRAIRFKPLSHPFATTAAGDGAAQTGLVDDLAMLTEQGILQLTIGQKIYGQWPLWMLPAGGGILSAGVYPIAQYGNNGSPDARAVYTLSKPLFIAPMINFRVDLLWPAGAVTLDSGNTNVQVVLDGDLIRPVQ